MPSHEIRNVVMFQISYIPSLVNCKPINLDVINPYLIKYINNDYSIPFDKFIVIKRKEKCEVVKLLWKGTVDGNICFGCEIHSDWPHGTDGSFKGIKLFQCRENGGVLIVNREEIESCESKDHPDHIKLNEDKVIKEDDICCLKSLERLTREEISRNSNLVWTVDKRLKGRCEWTGLINGEECVGISCDDYPRFPSVSGNYKLFEKFLIISKKIVFLSSKNMMEEKLYFIDDKVVDLGRILSIRSVDRNYSEFGLSKGIPLKVNWGDKREPTIGEVKWTGIINNEKCVGLDMEMKCDHGMDGVIDKDNKFDCERGHGLVTSLDDVELYLHKNKLKTFANGLIDPNQYIQFDEKSSVSWRNYQKNEDVYVNLLDNDIWLKGAIRWLGEMNNEEVVVIELEANHENGTKGKFWRNRLCSSLGNRVVATRLDNVNKYIPLKYKDIFVKNTNSIQASLITKDNDKYKFGNVIRINAKPIIYGEIKLFLNYYGQDLVGINVNIESINLLGKIGGEIFFQTPFFDVGCTGIIVKIESIEMSNEELKFINKSRIIDTKSIACKILNHSNNFCKNDVVKLNIGRNNIFYIINDFWKLNGVQCVEVVESIFSNGDKLYSREIDMCKIDQSEWGLKYYQHTIIDPSSIIILRKFPSSDFEIGNRIKFYLNETYELFEGVIKFIGRANNTLCGAVQLIEYKISDKNNELCKYLINQNETFHSIWRNSKLPIIFIPLNIMKLQDNCEYVNGIPVVNPKFVKRIEGMQIETERQIIFMHKGKQYFSLIKWKGMINGKYCLGCEIDFPCEFGTDGKYGDKILFTCLDKHGILIPVDLIDGCCEIVGHQNIVQYDSKIINPDNICCIRTDQNIGKHVKIYLNERIKRIDNNQYQICRWLGYVNNIKCVGVDLKYHVNEGTNGIFCGIKLFECQNKYGALYRLSEFISKNSGFELLPDIGLYIVDSFNIKFIENGKRIEKLMNYKCNERIYLLNIKWRGCVDGELCIGCELMNDSTFGTDGTFAGQKVFDCIKGKGVLIPVNTIDSSCEADKHNKIEKYSDGILGFNKNFHSINPDCICCVESLKYVRSCQSIKIGSRIKYVKGKQFFDGVCEWIGLVNGKESIGAKMKESSSSGTNGQFNNFKLFICEPKKGFLFLIEDIKHDIEKEKLYFICDKIVDKNEIYSVSLLDNSDENKKIGSPAITVVKFPDGNEQKMIGEIKWIGKINNEKCVGLDMEDKFDFGMNGKIKDHHEFYCPEGHGMITLWNNIELLENIDESLFCKNGIINPNKYLVCIENLEFLRSKNLKLNEFVFVLLKYSNGKRKKKGILRWCGKMNELSVCIVELNEEHELGTFGRFWRKPLIKCQDKRAIAVLSSNIYHYEPYESMIIPENDRIFTDIDINTAVKYYYTSDNELKDLFGTIRWSGKDENGEYLYGIELDDRIYNGTDGQFNGQRLFYCQNGHGILAAVGSVVKDSRFVDFDVSPENIIKSEECQDRQSSILTKLSEGLNKGIQGNANSCYFDSAIFALFVKSDVLDFMIDEINNENETNEITKQFRNILYFKIIYPLRKFGFVSFHRTNEMRDVIVKYGKKYEEMTKQESDMENVSALLSKLCPNEQLLSITSHSGSMTKCMFMQLFLTLTKRVKFMTSEEMLKISMVQNDIMFNELPTCLIIQAPRDARGINCYEFVLPMNIIEISQVCSNYFKKCYTCENEAVYQCKECIEGRLDISYSFLCENHKCSHNLLRQINISNISTSKVYLELKSIICIEKCHFVSYVKQTDITNQKIVNQWYFFDSMSSQSISNNYAIPKVDFSKEVTEFLNSNSGDLEGFVHGYSFEKIKRIVKDSYIFVYQNSAKTCY